MDGSAILLFALAVVGGVAVYTLRRRLEREIAARRAAEMRLGRVLEDMPVAIGIHDAGGRVTHLNRAFRTLFGYAADEIPAVSDWWERAFPEPDHRERMQHIAAGMMRAAKVSEQTGGPQEMTVTCRNGEEREVAFHYIRVLELSLWVLVDVSDHHRMEEAARLVNDHLLTQLGENVRLQEALREQALRDGLTGLFNRRYLDETFEREIARAHREHYPLTVMMVDIDYFKRLNDTHGHAAGDAMLREIATLLSRSVRTEDVVCRYGGEEFAILLPKMALAAAQQRADQWRRRAAEHRTTFGNVELNVSLSIGIATLPDHGDSATQLIHAADHALYRAKERGRNRVEIAQPSEAT